MIAPCPASSLGNLFKHENRSHFKLLKEKTLIRIMIFLVNTVLPVTLYSNMLTFTDSNKTFKLDRDLLWTRINYNLNVSHSNPQHHKLTYEFGKGMNFIFKQKGRKNQRDDPPMKLLKSPAFRVSSLLLPENLSELYERSKVLLQEKRAGNNFDIINEEIVAVVDKLLEYKCTSTIQQKNLLGKCLK